MISAPWYYVFDTRPADADRFLAVNKDWGHAARKPKTGPGRLQNGPRPAVVERGTGRSGEIDGGDGPRRRAPQKMVGAAGFEPATPTPPVSDITFFSVLIPCAPS